ncbi:MAG TPA: HAD family hydrolase [Casimicrobiaceae bacterium]|nr:HAD family hydrolase [Casimicrobiaceae bacterium]
MRAATSPEAWREGEPRKAVFVDKDGTLVHDVPYNVDPDRIVLIPGVGESLRRLQDAGFLLFVVSNQPGVALGRFPASALRGVEARLDELVGRHGVVFTGYCWCPHPPVGVRNAVVCTCRKPRPGMLLDAAATHGVALERSWMVGDILDDIEAGNRAGCRTILVDRGGETRWRAGRVRTPNAIVYQFADAAAMILDGTRDGAKGRPRVAPA